MGRPERLRDMLGAPPVLDFLSDMESGAR